MDVYNAIVRKRDRRRFLDRPIPPGALRRILQAARMTGSAGNQQPNRFILVQDRATLERMATLAPLAKWLGGAAAVVVIAQQGREHEFDAGRAAQSMMLAAFDQGIGSCPAHPPAAALRELLGIPENVHVNRVIAFGYVDPQHDAPPKAVARPRIPLEDLVHNERWEAGRPEYAGPSYR